MSLHIKQNLLFSFYMLYIFLTVHSNKVNY